MAKKRVERRFLPTMSDLIDRLCIVQLKAIHIPEHREDYMQERADIEHDIDLLLQQAFDETGASVDAKVIHAIIVLMLSNHFIWINESKARLGGNEQDKLLKATHSINGVRATSKNAIAALLGGRRDYKIDALAADLPPEFGNWRIFE